MGSTAAELPERKRRFGDAQILGMVLLAGGALWLLDSANLIALSFISVISILLIILGAGMMLSGGRPQAGVMFAGIALICALAAASFFAASAINIPLSEPTAVTEFAPVPFEGALMGDVNVAPSSIEELSSQYSFGLGDATLDLSNVNLPAGETPLLVKMGVGHLRIVVPAEASVRGHAELGAGEISVLGRVLSGGTGGSTSFNVPAATPEESNAILVLEIRGGLGEVEVLRAGV
jgi:predicted membrane protein